MKHSAIIAAPSIPSVKRASDIAPSPRDRRIAWARMAAADGCEASARELEELLADEPEAEPVPEFDPSLVHPDDPCQSKGWRL